MSHVTTFDSTRRYIFLPIFVTDAGGIRHEFDALLDTGAPATEFSDLALQYAGNQFIPQFPFLKARSLIRMLICHC